MALLTSVCSAAILTFETQYEYDSANPAWLTDLTIKQNVDTIDGAITPLKLIPVTDYPYKDTAESFKNDVDYYTSSYLIGEDTAKAAYIYFFELLSSSSGLVAGDISDDDIRTYLRNLGVVYPTQTDDETAIVARGLYVALVTGTISSVTPGITLEELAMNFVSGLTGTDTAALKSWLPSVSEPTLDDYILAASKYTLWSAGYDVDANTDASTVYRYVAALTLEKYGITVDTTSDFDTIKLKFLAAMLGTKYGVQLNYATLGDALEADSVALYVLKLIAMDNGLSIGSRSFEDAFLFVAENTDVFALEEGEFYADIYEYDIYVAEGLSYIWLNATPYNTDGTVIISADSTILKNSYYTQFALAQDVEVQTVTITVTSVMNNQTSTCTYKLNVHFGGDVPESAQTNTSLSDAVGRLYLSSETLLSGVLATIRMDTGVSSVLSQSFTQLETKAKTVMSVIAPTFDDESGESAAETTEEECISFLDKIGQIIDSDISGISGYGILTETSSETLANGFVTFGSTITE